MDARSRIKMPPNIILFLRIVFLVILAANNFLCSVLFNRLVFELFKKPESVLFKEFDSLRRIPNYCRSFSFALSGIILTFMML